MFLLPQRKFFLVALAVVLALSVGDVLQGAGTRESYLASPSYSYNTRGYVTNVTVAQTSTTGERFSVEVSSVWNNQRSLKLQYRIKNLSDQQLYNVQLRVHLQVGSQTLGKAYTVNIGDFEPQESKSAVANLQPDFDIGNRVYAVFDYIRAAVSREVTNTQRTFTTRFSMSTSTSVTYETSASSETYESFSTS